MYWIRAALAGLLLTGTAYAQSNPNFQAGTVLGAASLNNAFIAKGDAVNGTFLNPTINGGTILTTVTNVTTATYASTVNDRFICVSPTAPTTITLAPSPSTGLTQTVDDCSGGAAANNITVRAATGTIMGYSNVLINVNNASIRFLYNGSTWVIS